MDFLKALLLVLCFIFASTFAILLATCQSWWSIPLVLVAVISGRYLFKSS
jgi:hypothetical protein